MKNKRSYLFLIPAVSIFLTACMGNTDNKRMPSLTETFNKRDKKPFGANIAYRQLGALYPNHAIRDKKQAFTKTRINNRDTSSLYICIAPALFVNDKEADAMMDYVYAGNDLFISAGYIDALLLKRINCNEMFTYSSREDMFNRMKNTFLNAVTLPLSPYSYYYLPFRNYFFNIDSNKTRVLGFNEDKTPNSIVYFHGKGRLFLHCEPRAFSNYFLLQGKNYEYLQSVLSFTINRPDQIYWDDYYNELLSRKKGDKDENDFSALSEIMKHPSLAYAFWLSLALLLLYALFGSKRQQRIIKQLKPNENTTVKFTETIGRLYLQKKDNKNIADKIVTYFNEYIRNTYFLNTNLIDEDFITALSRKSAVPRDKVETLCRTMTDIHKSEEVNDYQLLSLQEQVQKFYKNRN